MYGASVKHERAPSHISAIFWVLFFVLQFFPSPKGRERESSLANDCKNNLNPDLKVLIDL
jgi:hypothetical protein